MTKKALPKGAIANQKRKQIRINIAKEALKNLSPKVKFPNRTGIYEYIADAVRTHERLTNTETKKGPCSRSGVYSIPEIKEAVEKFWLTGILVDDDVDLSKTTDAVAKKKLLDQEIEISNLKHELEENKRFLSETDKTVRKLQEYIGSDDAGGQSAHLQENPVSSSEHSNREKEMTIEALCQIIFKLECWGKGIIERDNDGAFVDLTNETKITSAKLMKEYTKRVPISKAKE